ncbi:MAG: Mur ligase family protein [Myxococcota bacterium]|nr:Mur ligase family protein [Myxococcota bacterium]
MKPLSRQAVSLALSARDVRAIDGADLPMVFTDTRRPVAGGLFVALVGERFDAHDHLDGAIAAGAGGLVVSRAEAVPADLPTDCFVAVVDDTREALVRLAVLVRGAHPGRFAAVTGSVGKTTVKDMLAAALRDSGEVAASPGNWNNEIGVPLSLFSTTGQERFVVLELGMSAPGEIDALTHIALPSVGVVTAAAAAAAEAAAAARMPTPWNSTPPWSSIFTCFCGHQVQVSLAGR